MPLPLLFIGFAAVTGATGIGANAKAYTDKKRAKTIIEIANQKVEKANEELEIQRDEVSIALEELGFLKVTILESNVMRFIKSFEKIKNVDFRDSLGLDEIKNLHIDQKDFEELKVMGNLAIDLAQGATTGAASGALTAFGAWGAAQALATASTGTAISTLSGAAATNATLAFFGGGSLAAGGLGMAGGTMVLGGLVAGPALLVMGLVTSIKAQEQLDQALSSKAEAEKTIAELNTLAYQCSAIRRRSYMFYTLLSRQDLKFIQLIKKMETILEEEGDDFSKYTPSSKKSISMAATSAGTIKSILDTPILNGDGDLTEESRIIIEKLTKVINSKK